MATATETKKIDETTIRVMFEAGAHYGYARARRHPTSSRFIFGVKNGVEIFDLEKTHEALERVKQFVSECGKTGKKILFVTSKSEMVATVKDAAHAIGAPYVVGRWIGGTLTNFEEIRKRVLRLRGLQEEAEKGLDKKYTKKERVLIRREMDKLEEQFGGLMDLDTLPAAVFVVDPKQEAIAVAEAHNVRVPVIAIANSDCNMDVVEYPIPANDAQRASISFFVNAIVSAYKNPTV